MRTPLPPMPVVIDCCPLLNVLSLNAIFACDLLLVPVSADHPGAAGRQGSRALAQRARAGVQAPAAAPLPADALRPAAQNERADPRADAIDIPSRRRSASRRSAKTPSWRKARAIKLDVFRHAPGSRGAHDYEALAVELAAGGFVR